MDEENKVSFLERFVFCYDAAEDGFGKQKDVYEMFNIKGEKSLYAIFKSKAIRMTQEQYNDILSIMSKNENEIEIVVFYELNKIPMLAFYGEDYIELTDKIFEAKNNYIRRNKYEELETTPEIFNYVKNDLLLKFLRYHICNPFDDDNKNADS